jgi:hypothetical protein
MAVKHTIEALCLADYSCVETEHDNMGKDSAVGPTGAREDLQVSLPLSIGRLRLLLVMK